MGLSHFLERMQAAELLHHIQPGAHPQVEGVAQDDLRVHVLQALRRDALDRAIGAHRHEDRRFDHAVVERQAAAAGVAAKVAALGVVGLEKVELQHGLGCVALVGGRSRPVSGPGAGCSSIASP
jgi:hypothetical protein